MTILLAIPIYRVVCNVGIDRGRAWSVIDEALLWSVAQAPRSIADLATDAGLPHQVVIASIARLMRFRLIEVSMAGADVAFQASQSGKLLVTSGEPLPFFPKRISRRVSFVIERVGGCIFKKNQIRLLPGSKVDRERAAGVEVRTLVVRDGAPSMSNEANLDRLAEIATQGWDERIAQIDARTAAVHDHEYMILRVVDGAVEGFPEAELRAIVAKVASRPGNAAEITVPYIGARETVDLSLSSYACDFDADDIVIGGSAQRQSFEALLERAHRRVIIHSTFLDAAKFEALEPMIQSACQRGVRFDLLWGAERDEKTETKNALAASNIAKRVRGDRHMRGLVHVGLRSTGSHAKLMLLDTRDDGWIGAVGSCNWLSSPFNAVELTVIVRHQHAVADIANALQNLVGRRGLADDRRATDSHRVSAIPDCSRSPTRGAGTDLRWRPRREASIPGR